MPISILPQDQDGQELFNAISSFFRTFGIGNLLRKCNAQKEKGVPVLDISEKVGYKTHSAVVKRMQKIREVFDDFIKEDYDQYKETLES